MRPTIIPTRQNDPPWIMLWRLDEAAPFTIGLVVGMLTHHLFICLALGIGFSHIYKKVNGRFPRAFVLHWIYSKGFWLFPASRTMKLPYVRRFLPNLVRPRQVKLLERLKKQE